MCLWRGGGGGGRGSGAAPRHVGRGPLVPGAVTENEERQIRPGRKHAQKRVGRTSQFYDLYAREWVRARTRERGIGIPRGATRSGERSAHVTGIQTPWKVVASLFMYLMNSWGLMVGPNMSQLYVKGVDENDHPPVVCFPGPCNSPMASAPATSSSASSLTKL